jgi:hypothetical protein
MIEIDDAGSGSLIGGTGIGILKKDSQEYLFHVIPIKYFQYPSFTQKKYQDYVITIVEKAIEQLQVHKHEKIVLCQGYIFDKLRQWLSQKGYHWESIRIKGLLQTKVEESFNQYVISLGLPKDFIIHARYAFGFHRLFKWVMADYPQRLSLCKTGWKSWQKWSNVDLKGYHSIAFSNGFCLKCGKAIHKYDPIKVIEYQTNKKWGICLHTHCPQ